MACAQCTDGIIVTCPDDMCRGAGECLHGDGEIACECEGGGADSDDDPGDCWECDGTGTVHDCGEDTCPCAHPEVDDLLQCPACGGTGAS